MPKNHQSYQASTVKHSHYQPFLHFEQKSGVILNNSVLANLAKRVYLQVRTLKLIATVVGACQHMVGDSKCTWAQMLESTPI